MFIGHIAVGLAAKRAAPRTSVAMLVFAADFLDVLFTLFLWLGVERIGIQPTAPPLQAMEFDYPWSHSLLLALLWSVVLALVYRWRRRSTRGTLVVGLAVFSHWVLDWISHLPDVPLAPGLATRVGLGLWRSVPATVTVEAAIFAAGLAIYLATTRAKGRLAGHVWLWSIVVLLVDAGFLAGPPPPNVLAVKVIDTLAAVLVVLWFIPVEHYRTLRARPSAARA